MPAARAPLELRDRTIALLMFASRRRHPEIAVLDVEKLDFERNRRFLFLHVAKSKMDQRGRGQMVTIPRMRSASNRGHRHL